MIKNRHIVSFIFLAFVSVLSMFELNGILAATLFTLVATSFAYLTYRKDVMISPVVFITGAYVLGYPFVFFAPSFFAGLSFDILSEGLSHGMLWSLRGFCAFALAYVFFERFAKGGGKYYGRDEKFYISRIGYTVYVLTSIGWLSVLSWVASVAFFGFSLVFIEGETIAVDSGAGSSQQVLSLLVDLKYPFLFGFIMLYFWGKTDKHLVLLCGALLLISVLDIVTIGSKGSIIRLVLVGLLSLSFLPVRINLKQIIAGLLAIITVYGSFSVITEYRTLMHARQKAGLDAFDFSVQAEAFQSALVASMPFMGATEDRLTRVEKHDIFQRIGNGIFSFSDLMEFTGRDPPYENALESFLVPIYSVAPRVLMPEKPEFFNSGRNAKEFYGWSYGGVSVTLLGSLYFAWGYVGIILGMAFIGGLLAYLVKQGRSSGIYSPNWLILFVTLFILLMDVGVIFQAIMSNVIRVTLILWLLYLLFPLVRANVRRRMSRILIANQPVGGI